MSAPLFGADVLFYQRLLKASGYYDDTLDGIWGSNTTAADNAFQADAQSLKSSLGAFDPRTEGHISRLHIKAQELARKFMTLATTGPNTCKIISGTRTYAEQDALYRQGRWGNPGPIVTRARGGQSNHNFSIAWDVGLFNGAGVYLRGATAAELAAYEHIATIVDLNDLEWGGHWSRFIDRPHYQAKTGMTTSQIRPLFEAGSPYL